MLPHERPTASGMARELALPAITRRWRSGQDSPRRIGLDVRLTAANLNPTMDQPGHDLPLACVKPAAGLNLERTFSIRGTYYSSPPEAAVAHLMKFYPRQSAVQIGSPTAWAGPPSDLSDYCLRLRVAARPAKLRPRRARAPGSGTLFRVKVRSSIP